MREGKVGEVTGFFLGVGGGECFVNSFEVEAFGWNFI
jgi:hypothetical protein